MAGAARVVEGRARIGLPLDTCWEKLRDLARAVHYVPGLTACTITTDAREGVGASRVVVSKQAGAVDETVTEWKDGESFTLRLHKGDRRPAPFARAHFTYRLAPAGVHCEIHTRMEYEVAFGPLGRLLDGLVLRRVTSKSVQDVADALAAYYERDER